MGKGICFVLGDEWVWVTVFLIWFGTGKVGWDGKACYIPIA